MRESATHTSLRVLVWVVLGAAVAGTALAESAPTLLNFPGRFTSSVGAPVTGSQSVQFTLIQGGTATENPSTGTIVYQETATVTADSNGVFAFVIGSGTPTAGQTLTETDFITYGQPLYVELKVGTETLLPRRGY